jgi:hypothetical protein
VTQPVHSPIGASSMYRWSKCPGSVRLSRGIESVSSKYAEEGTQAHEVAAYLLQHNAKPGFEVFPEMMEAVIVYVNAVNTDRARGSNDMWVEHRFDLSKVYKGLYGTADCVVYYVEEKLLQVWDYKHGAGIAVDVVDNSQLKYYGLGALLSLGIPCKEVELVIVQPRCPHPDGSVRRHRFKAVDLIDFAADLQEFAKATEDPNAPLVAGEHCRFCPAAGLCPKLHEQALISAKETFSHKLPYDPVKLSETLTRLDMVEAWAKGVREFAYQEAVRGRVPPGFKLVEKRATRQWRSDVDAVIHLKTTLGLLDHDIFERKLKSPAQVEKFLNKEGKKQLAEWVFAESSGLKLTPISDPTPEVKRGVEVEFEKISP